ncbi:hypothetical protein J502_2646 [Acinetobacter sp. 1294596]|uniref:hypothetical protein n=1 Tax=Acinetobacter TaxID=469 RepID=UPI00044D1DFE|nr:MULTISPECIES: hypothetical protein [Acinetobacter]EXF56219.1 hypothetical protein J502_2646 [Acinetobacter sp. 1294596]MCK4091879.1 hypothetical protein [Acinetobacter radioresistens]
MANKISLIAALVITYLVLLMIGFLIYTLIITPVQGADITNAIVGILGWTATLYAPVAALFLLNNWKEQVKHDKALDCLTQAMNIINLIHQTMYGLKSKNRSEEIITNFEVLDDIKFNIYMDNLIDEYKIENQKIFILYNQLSCSLNQFKLITATEEESFEYILSSYFKINWYLDRFIKEFLDFFVQVQQKKTSLDELKFNNIYLARKLQIDLCMDPDIQKNQDGSYLFMTSYDLKITKEESFKILNKIRKKL